MLPNSDQRRMYVFGGRVYVQVRTIIPNADTLRSVVAIAGLATLMMWGSLYNGHPLMFPDSGVYIYTATGRAVTLDRSPFYGLFGGLFMMGRLSTTWLWIWSLAQCFIVALSMLLLTKAMLPRWSVGHRVALLVPIVLMTALPWHASQIMPDALAGSVAILSLISLNRRLSHPGTATFLLLLLVITLVHNTHFFILAAAAAAMLIAGWISGASAQQQYRVAARASGILILGVVLTVALNGVAHGRWQFAPMGNYFVFASLQQERLTQEWLDEHCPTPRASNLCQIRDRLGADSQAILRDSTNPVHKLVTDSRIDPQIMAEMGYVARSAVVAYPAAFVESVARDTAEQFISFAPLNDLCPEGCSKRGHPLDHYLGGIDPTMMDRFLQSRQGRGDIDKTLMRRLVVPMTWTGLVALFIVLVPAFRRRDRALLDMLLAVILALVVSAIITGALSEPYDRYQSRLAWLAPLAALIGAARLRYNRRDGHKNFRDGAAGEI